MGWEGGKWRASPRSGDLWKLCSARVTPRRVASRRVASRALAGSTRGACSWLSGGRGSEGAACGGGERSKEGTQAALRRKEAQRRPRSQPRARVAHLCCRRAGRTARCVAAGDGEARSAARMQAIKALARTRVTYIIPSSMVRLPPSPLGLYTHFRVWASGRWHCRSVTIIIRIAPNGAPTPQNGPRLCQDVARTSAAKSAGRPPCGALGGCGPARLLLHGRFPVVFILDQSASPHT